MNVQTHLFFKYTFQTLNFLDLYTAKFQEHEAYIHLGMAKNP